jgi:3-methyladenine DNA glycosylase/8-oxoguanine DNA glycosylase
LAAGQRNVLMFALCREDLFAIDDLGLQQAVIGLYDLKHRKKKIMNAKILKIAEQWAPYRTYAACICGDGRIIHQ